MDDLLKNFDAESYRLAYPDVALSGLDPQTHYLKYGARLGRAPNPGLVPTPPAPPVNDTHPSILDVRYAQGILPPSAPIRHSERVTILMPSHNNEPWLTRALHAALSQQGVEVEVILIDDGSTDGSVKCAHQIARTAPNLKVISLLRNFGCYYARNVGLMHATGDFVTILDTDDIMPPDRIARQLDALKAATGVVACRCQQRRWTPDYTMPVSELKYGENSLLWRRDVLNRMGAYDSVRYSGDGEFRFRLEKTYGVAAVLKMPDEVYFTRTLDNSLTTSATSRVFTLQEGQLALTMSPSRKNYRRDFTAWHNSADRQKLKVTFPQYTRPFALGGDDQNASPSLGELRIGVLESSVARRDALEQMLPDILPQLNELRLYLNDYDTMPDFARNPKIRAVLGHEAQGDLDDTGTFHDVPEQGAYVFALEDRLRYPRDYTARMIYNIEILGRACVVGVRGGIFPAGPITADMERRILAFKDGQLGQFVDVLETGTAAWHSACFRPDLTDFHSKGQSDLWFAAAAARRDIALFCVPGSSGWVVERPRAPAQDPAVRARQQEQYAELYNSVIAQVLENGRVRRKMMAHLGRCYDSDTLRAARLVIPQNVTQEAADLIGTRRTITHLEPACAGRARLASQAVPFHLVVTGCNCKHSLTACMRAIAQQLPGPYAFDVTVVDDGSDDGTYEDLARMAVLPQARLIRVTRTMGMAYARHKAITGIDDAQAVVVPMEMGDVLEPDALRRIAQQYLDTPDGLMTLGWGGSDTDGSGLRASWTAQVIDRQRVRSLETAHAAHLQSFRRSLYDVVEMSDMLDAQGSWLDSCADAALIYPLIDQCHSNEVVFSDAPIYRQTRNREAEMVSRFGKAHLDARLTWLRGKSPKPRVQRTRARSE